MSGRLSAGVILSLAFAKSVYLHGCRHAERSDPLSRALAIHNFDLTVETVLRCLHNHYNIPIKGSSLGYLFRNLERRSNVRFILKQEMLELRRIRNQVQHAGIIPSHEAVLRYKDYVEKFLKRTVKENFNVEFDEVSMAVLIENENIRRRIIRAEKEFSNGNYKKCINMMADVLIDTVFDFCDIYTLAGMLTAYFGGYDKLREVLDEKYPEKYKENEMIYNLANDLREALHELGMASTTMQFLDEYRADFLKLMDIISNNLNNIDEYTLRELARFAIGFVTEVILKWQGEGLLKSST